MRLSLHEGTEGMEPNLTKQNLNARRVFCLTVAKVLAGMFCFLSSPLIFCSCKDASCTETEFEMLFLVYIHIKN